MTYRKPERRHVELRPVEGGYAGQVQPPTVPDFDVRRERSDGRVLREPENGVYGRFKVLRRSDGLLVVHDPQQWPPRGPVFVEESDARAAAASMAGV